MNFSASQRERKLGTSKIVSNFFLLICKTCLFNKYFTAVNVKADDDDDDDEHIKIFTK